MTATPISPLRYEPAFEEFEDDEAQTTEQLAETMLQITRTTLNDTGHALRSVHAKSHGLLEGELTVLDDLPETLAQGLFAKPGTYSAVIRLSTTPGDILDDSVSTPRGMAIKIASVEGERLSGSEGDTTQDFVLVNGPAFQASSGSAFLKNLKMLAATTDSSQTPKKAASAVARATEAFVEAFGGKSPKLLSLGGQPETHILGETFYSQVPVLYGPYMAKISVAPASPELKALTGKPVDLDGKPNGLREAVVDFFSTNAAEWELRVQLCTDLDKMPVEDPEVVWPEEVSPYVAVARLTAPAQEAWSKSRSATVDDGLAFSPWHGLAAHRPLGRIMRMRKSVYDRIARFRRDEENVSSREPRSLDGLAGFSDRPNTAI